MVIGNKYKVGVMGNADVEWLGKRLSYYKFLQALVVSEGRGKFYKKSGEKKTHTPTITGASSSGRDASHFRRVNSGSDAEGVADP